MYKQGVGDGGEMEERMREMEERMREMLDLFSPSPQLGDLLERDEECCKCEYRKHLGEMVKVKGEYFKFTLAEVKSMKRADCYWKMMLEFLKENTYITHLVVHPESIQRSERVHDLIELLSCNRVLRGLKIRSTRKYYFTINERFIEFVGNSERCCVNSLVIKSVMEVFSIRSLFAALENNSQVELLVVMGYGKSIKSSFESAKECLMSNNTLTCVKVNYTKDDYRSDETVGEIKLLKREISKMLDENKRFQERIKSFPFYLLLIKRCTHSAWSRMPKVIIKEICKLIVREHTELYVESKKK